MSLCPYGDPIEVLKLKITESGSRGQYLISKIPKQRSIKLPHGIMLLKLIYFSYECIIKTSRYLHVYVNYCCVKAEEKEVLTRDDRNAKRVLFP